MRVSLNLGSTNGIFQVGPANERTNVFMFSSRTLETYVIIYANKVMVQFEQPIGAVADVKELEYISALHQTADKIRRDGSIHAQDIKFYLKSRFGVNVTEKEVCEQILQGLGGGSDDEEVIDLMELASILLIPVLLKANMDLRGDDLPEDVVAPPPNLIEFVYQMILRDTLGQSDPTPTLTVDLLQRIFKTYGEDKLAADKELLQKMIAQAGVADEEGNSKFDVSAFATAITEDVTLFNIQNEYKSSSVYHDAIEGDPGSVNQVKESDDTMTLHEPTEPLAISKAFTAPAIEDAASLEDCDRASSVFEAREVERSTSKRDKDGDDMPFEDEPMTLDGDDMPFEDEPPKSSEISRSFTAPAIDTTVGAYRSKTLPVVLWLLVLFSIIYYQRRTLDAVIDAGNHKYCPDSDEYAWGVQNSGWSANSSYFSGMACEASVTIVEWIWRFLTFCFVGLFYMSMGSVGNTETAKSPLIPFIGLCFVLTYILIVMQTNDYFEKTVLSMLVCAGAIPHLLHIIYLSLSEGSDLKHRLGKRAMKSEVDLKSAQSYKLNNMAANACELHRQDYTQKVLGTCFSKGVHAFYKSAESDVKISGGFLWGWKLIWSRDVLKKEGIPFSARMLASNASQYIIIVAILLLGIFFLEAFKDAFGREENRQQLQQYIASFFNQKSYENAITIAENMGTRVVNFLASLNSSAAIDINCEEQNITAANLCALLDLENMGSDAYNQTSLLDAVGFSLEDIFNEVRQTVDRAADTAVNNLFPEKLYMVVVPLSFGTICSTLNAFWLAVGYLPSVTSTYIQLRTGVIPTLKDDLFNVYRVQPDSVTMITGSIFWGCLYSSLIVNFLVSLLVFLFVWQGTVFLAQRFIVIGITAIVVSIIRMGICIIFRFRCFQNFYRTKPAAANFTFLCLEWANFILSAAFLFVRMAKLFVATGMNAGRIDTPIFAKGAANIGTVDLDAYPIMHMRDILSREAHRHPYIEMLGTVYLMKLRYGKAFGTNAGSCWRLLFVYALMPWLQQYRIFTDDTVTEESLEVQDASDDDKNEKQAPLLLPKGHDTMDMTNEENVERIRELEGEIQRLRAALAETASLDA